MKIVWIEILTLRKGRNFHVIMIKMARISVRFAQILIMKIILTDIHGIFPQNAVKNDILFLFAVCTVGIVWITRIHIASIDKVISRASKNLVRARLDSLVTGGLYYIQK